MNNSDYYTITVSALIRAYNKRLGRELMHLEYDHTALTGAMYICICMAIIWNHTFQIGSSNYGSLNARTDPDQTPLLHSENGGPAKSQSVANMNVNTNKGQQSNLYSPSK